MKSFNKRDILSMTIFILIPVLLVGFAFSYGIIAKKIEIKKAEAALNLLERAMRAEQRYFEEHQAYTENPLDLDVFLPGLEFEGKEENGFYWGKKFGFKFYFEPYANTVKAIRSGRQKQPYSIGFDIKEGIFYCDSVSEICSLLFGERKDKDPIGSEFQDHSGHDHGPHGHNHDDHHNDGAHSD